MLAPAEAFTRRPIVFMDHYAGAGRVFMSDASVPALAILIADHRGRGGNGGQPKCDGTYECAEGELADFVHSETPSYSRSSERWTMCWVPYPPRPDRPMSRL